MVSKLLDISQVAYEMHVRRSVFCVEETSPGNVMPRNACNVEVCKFWKNFVVRVNERSGLEEEDFLISKSNNSPGFIGENEFPEFEIPEDQIVLMTEMNGLGSLLEQSLGFALSEPSPSPDVSVKVAVMTLEQEIPLGLCRRFDEFDDVAGGSAPLEFHVGLQENIATLVRC